MTQIQRGRENDTDTFAFTRSRPIDLLVYRGPCCVGIETRQLYLWQLFCEVNRGCSGSFTHFSWYSLSAATFRRRNVSEYSSIDLNQALATSAR